MAQARTAVGAVIVHGGRAFVLRRAASAGFLPGCWDVPGGHVEGDESVDDALRREIAEETGWVLRSVVAELPGMAWTEPDGTACTARNFLVAVDGDLRHPVLAPAEHDQWRWVAAGDIGVLAERRDAGDDDVATLVAAGLVEAAGHPDTAAGRRAGRPARVRLRFAAYVALVLLVEAAVVWFAFRLDGLAPFAGMLVPEILLVAVGVALTIAPLALVPRRRRRTPHLARAGGVLTVAMVALSWFAGLPVKMLVVDGAATSVARQLLAAGAGSGRTGPDCRSTPSVLAPVRPLVDAVRACVVHPGPLTPLVEFTDAAAGAASASASGGWQALVYSPRTVREQDGSRVAPEPGECVAHLEGPWWAMAPPLNPGTGPCPLGYRFVPGG